MSYISNTEKDLELMLKEIGIKDTQELFSCLPKELLLKSEPDIPESYSEQELMQYFGKLSSLNNSFNDMSIFLGAGSYFHYVPAVVNAVLSRPEFYTAYTPYQPEASQGTLQAIFEFQTYICQLTGMEVANASMYDGATALAEAILMANRINNRSEIILAETIHPEYKQVVRTYLKNFGITIQEVSFLSNGKIDLNDLNKKINPQTCAVAIQNPNFFGVIEDYEEIFGLLQSREVIKIAVISEPLSLALLKPPGDYQADIVIGEGQSFGMYPCYGGPTLGFMSTKIDYVRKMPGRLAGIAYDSHGNRGFVLTLSTREQHIRREKATSNICTNQALCALAATVYLAALGPKGLKKIANVNFQNAHYLQEELCKLNKCYLKFDAPFFNEFVIGFDADVDSILEACLKEKIIAGLSLKKFFPNMQNCLMINVTEMHTKSMIDNFLKKLEGLL